MKQKLSIQAILVLTISLIGSSAFAAGPFCGRLIFGSSGHLAEINDGKSSPIISSTNANSYKLSRLNNRQCVCVWGRTRTIAGQKVITKVTLAKDNPERRCAAEGL